MGRGKGNPSFEQIKLVRDDSLCRTGINFV
ncbi:hypothetical protein PMI08_04710 [Brevibacillus sp. CF112]|nr:hypothetical protein PMI08_04710 [Brevibacillus sp. CF112]